LYNKKSIFSIYGLADGRLLRRKSRSKSNLNGGEEKAKKKTKKKKKKKRSKSKNGSSRVSLNNLNQEALTNLSLAAARQSQLPEDENDLVVTSGRKGYSSNEEDDDDDDDEYDEEEDQLFDENCDAAEECLSGAVTGGESGLFNSEGESASVMLTNEELKKSLRAQSSSDSVKFVDDYGLEMSQKLRSGSYGEGETVKRPFTSVETKFKLLSLN
jgi:hypothetical protein